jgi:SAM-dependent methyltransferase
MTDVPLPGPAVERLYEQKVLVNDSPKYLDRYAGYDFEAVFSDVDLRRIDFPRLVIIREFARLANEYGLRATRALALNGGSEGDPELHHLPYENLDLGDYELDPVRYDMHALDPPHRDYDFVLFSQTLEHVSSPLLAMRNVHDVMGEEGWVWTSVPTVNFQHNLPYNFITGFTPIGLASLIEQAGFSVVEIGQWGNRKYLAILFEFGHWPTYHDLRPGMEWRGKSFAELRTNLSKLSYLDLRKDGRTNEFDVPVQTWVLARKGEAAKSDSL